MVNPSAPPPEKKDPYFNGPTKKKPGVSKGTVAFLDYLRCKYDGGISLKILYVAVRRDYQGTGLARKLIDSLFSTQVENKEVKMIDFGEIVSSGIGKIYREKRDLYDSTGGVKVRGNFR